VAVQLVNLAHEVFDLMVAGAKIEERRTRRRKSVACFSGFNFSVGVCFNRCAVAPLGIGDAGIEVRYAPRQLSPGFAGSHRLESLALCFELLECSGRSLDLDKALFLFFSGRIGLVGHCEHSRCFGDRQLGKFIPFKCRCDAVGELVRAAKTLGLKAVSVKAIAIFDLALDVRGIGFELFGEPAVERDVEQLPQNLEPVLAVRHQETLEPALRQQDNLAELLCAIAEKTFDMAEDGTDLLFCERNAAVIRTDIIDCDVRYVEQPGSVWLHGVTLASRLRPCLVRLTLDVVSLGSQFELQAYFG